MRQTDFRVYDPTKKKMYYNAIVGGDIVIVEYNGDLEDNDFEPTYYTCKNSTSPEPFITMPFTGSYDIRGNKIYHGDIVRHDSDWLTDEHGEKKDFKPETKKHKHWVGVVEWEQETTSYIIGPHRILCRTDMNIIEVIGNIFQNPEIEVKMHYPDDLSVS